MRCFILRLVGFLFGFEKVERDRFPVSATSRAALSI
jgi:hypothetical protein